MLTDNRQGPNDEERGQLGSVAMTVRTVIFVLIGLVAAAVLASLLAPGRFGRSSAYDQYLCTLCGLKRADELRKIGPFTYRHHTTFAESSVSGALHAPNCQHSWLLYRYGHTFRGLLVGYSADGGCQSQAVPFLLGDDAFARDLARMQHPGRTWGSLVAALNSNRAFDEALSEWRQNADDGAFSIWAVTNGYWAPNTDK